jgi:hypothetical protein
LPPISAPERGPDGLELAYCRQRFIVECRAANVVAVDCPFTFSDADGVARDTRFARRLGYGAKSLVDPAHAAIVNGVLTPGDDELRRARCHPWRHSRRHAKRAVAVSNSTVRWSRCRPIPMRSG